MVNCIYIHIPFCEKKCNYCAFCSFGLIKKKNEYLEALQKEINFYYKKENTLSAIYLGGGTPSLLETDDIEQILKNFNFNQNTEITIEINPNTISKEKLTQYKNMGINRLSIGIQSFQDELLNTIGRNHTKKEALLAIEQAKNAGFQNISIDLMYGLPNQTLSLWENCLQKALELDIEHISLYGLKIEEGTNFYKFPPPNLPDLDIQADMYEMALDILGEKFEHYEFSNFAKSKEFQSRHNMNYWSLGEYWGFGLSASGFIQNKRYTNTFNFQDYIKNPLNKNYHLQTEKENIEEEIFLGLRKKEGIDFSRINKKYDIDIFKKYEKTFEKFLNAGFMEKTKNGIKLTKKGILISNEILCEFVDV